MDSTLTKLVLLVPQERGSHPSSGAYSFIFVAITIHCKRCIVHSSSMAVPFKVKRCSTDQLRVKYGFNADIPHANIQLGKMQSEPLLSSGKCHKSFEDSSSQPCHWAASTQLL